MFFTALEKTILWNRMTTLFVWCEILLMFIGAFYIHWIFGVIFIILGAPIVVWFCWKVGQFYFPSKGYFHCFFFRHSKQEREQLSEKSEQLGRYPHVGEIVCLDDWLIFKKFGVILQYQEIEKISYEKYGGFRATPQNSFKIVLQTIDAKKYYTLIFNNCEPFFSGGSYYQLTNWICSHQKNKNTRDGF